MSSSNRSWASRNRRTASVNQFIPKGHSCATDYLLGMHCIWQVRCISRSITRSKNFSRFWALYLGRPTCLQVEATDLELQYSTVCDKSWDKKIAFLWVILLMITGQICDALCVARDLRIGTDKLIVLEMASGVTRKVFTLSTNNFETGILLWARSFNIAKQPMHLWYFYSTSSLVHMHFQLLTGLVVCNTILV